MLLNHIKHGTDKSPLKGINTVWEYVYENSVVLMYFILFTRCQLGKTCAKLVGLEENAQYALNNSKTKYSGNYLMNVGLYFDNIEEFGSQILIFKKII